MSVFGKFPRTFWVANVIELFERWAWYGFFMLFANYLTGSSDAGGLEFTQEQKGWLMGVGTGILYFLPVFDRCDRRPVRIPESAVPRFSDLCIGFPVITSVFYFYGRFPYVFVSGGGSCVVQAGHIGDDC